MNFLSIEIEQLLRKLIYNKQLPIVCAILLAFFIILTLFSFFSLFSLKQVEVDKKHVDYQKPEIQAIIQQHLFGAYKDPLVVQAHIIPVNFALKAIFYAETNQKKSGALISEINGFESFYYEGDVLPSGAIIKQILPDKVIIDQGGNITMLEFLIPKLEFAPLPNVAIL